MESIERTATINPDLAQDSAQESHGRVGRQTIYVGGAYCPQNQPRADAPPEPRQPLEQAIAYTTSDDVDVERGTALDRVVATWPAWVRIVLVAVVLVAGAVAMLTAGAGVGAILTGTSFLP